MDGLLALSSLSPGAPAGASRGLPTRAEAAAAAGRFEALLLDLLLKEMTVDLGEGGFFGEESGAALQQGMFVGMLAEELAVHGPGLGVKDRLVDDWVRHGRVREEDGGKEVTRG